MHRGDLWPHPGCYIGHCRPAGPTPVTLQGIYPSWTLIGTGHLVQGIDIHSPVFSTPFQSFLSPCHKLGVMSNLRNLASFKALDKEKTVSGRLSEWNYIYQLRGFSHAIQNIIFIYSENMNQFAKCQHIMSRENYF